MTIGSAVITGAASGIGAAVARRLAKSGARIVLADIEVEKAAAVAEEIRASGGNACAIFADQSETESLAALAAQSIDWCGAPDLVFANAGVGAGGPIHTTPRRNIDWVLAVNLVGPMEVAQAFLPAMIGSGKASRFAVTASEHAVGLPERGGQASIYTISKHGVLGFAETLRRDLAATEVAVSVVCPAVVDTEIWNPMRHRQERFGGPRQLPESARPDPQQGISSDLAAERILEGFDAGEFYVFTHGADLSEVHRARSNEIDAALKRFARLYGAGA